MLVEGLPNYFVSSLNFEDIFSVKNAIFVVLSTELLIFGYFI